MEELPVFDNVWRGPGYYWIRTGDSPGDMYEAMGYAETESELCEEYSPYLQFAFASEDIPYECIEMSEKAWDGPGAYVFTKIGRDYDIDYCADYVESPAHLADGLFRIFGADAISEIRKYQEGEDRRALHFICFPAGYRGSIRYGA